MSVAALVPNVRIALGVSSSYDDEIIPALIRRCILRLLRDYHFPKSVVRADITPLTLDQQSIALPAGFKKELRVQFYNPSDTEWSEPLTKVTGFQRPYPDGSPRHYWLEGTSLWLDTPLTGGWETYTLQLFYESTLVSAHENWFTEDFEDAVFTYSVFRGSAEMRKPEVTQIYGPLWNDERTSLAIYAHELEWGNVEMLMRAPRARPSERYPA
jgi:hypothetical protein